MSKSRAIKKRTKAIFLFSVVMLTVSLLSFSALGAKTSNYYSYNQPNTTTDYAYWNGRKVVKASGTTTREIQWMQSAMNFCIDNKVFSGNKLEVDGSFGPASKAATILFQKKLALLQMVPLDLLQ